MDLEEAIANGPGVSSAREASLSDHYADDIASLHAIASLAPGDPDDRLTLLIEAGCASLDLDCGLVLLRSGTELASPLRARVVAGPRISSSAKPGSVVEDRRIADALARQATVASLGGPGASGRESALGDGPLVACPLWVTGRIAGAIAFAGQRPSPPFSSWQLSLVDLVADGVCRVLEREADIRALVRLESQAQAMIAAMPDPVVRVRRDGQRVGPDGAALAAFDPCARTRSHGGLDPRTEDQVLTALAGALDTGEVQTRIHSATLGPRARRVEARYAPAGTDEVLCIVRDITDQHRAEAALAEQVAFEALVASISTNLISCASEDLDAYIERGLGEIAQFFDAELAYIDEVSPDGSTLRISHQWSVDETSGSRSRGERVDVADLGWLSARFELAGHVFVRGAGALPLEATAQAHVREDDRGALWVRLGSDGEMVGVLGLTWRSREPPETDEVLGLVRFAADAFLGAMRRRTVSLLADGQAEVFELIARGAPVGTALLAAKSLLDHDPLDITALVATVDETNHLSLVTDEVDPPTVVEAWSSWFAAIEADLSNPFGQAVVTGEPVMVSDIRTDPRFDDGAMPAGCYRSATVLPVRSPRTGRTLALVAMLGTEPGAPIARSVVRDSVLSLVTVAAERFEDERRLAHQATHDPLTGVGNRAALRDRLNVALARSQRTGRAVGVLFADLDGFKAVNDRYGHDRGDRLLVEVAERITNAVRPSDTVCRTGGDEFVVVCEDLADPEQAHVIADRVRHAIDASPVDIGETRLEVGASVGVAVANLPIDDADRLLRTADLAMYATKQRRATAARERGIDLRHPAISSVWRIEPLTADLGLAIEQGALALDHQPLVGRDGSLAGVEVLLRWDHPEMGAIGADRIHAAATPELARELGHWTRRQALAERRRWIEIPGVGVDVPVHVDLGTHELGDPDLVDAVLGDLAEGGVGPEALVLEVGERDLVPPANRALAARLARAGIGVLVEGVGTGGMPLTDLAELDIRGIKLGCSLVERVDDPELRGLEVVRSLVLLAHGLGWRSVAVGVDTEHQRATLLGFGIHAVQGLAVAMPVTLEDLYTWLGADPPD